MQVGRRRRSIGSQRALGRRPRVARRRSTPTLVGLVDRVTRRMRAADRVGRTVVLRLRFDDFTRVTRSHTLPRPTVATRDTILDAARALLAAAQPLIERARPHAGRRRRRQPRRRRRVQLALPFDDRHGTALDTALDDVRDRFGTAALTRAVLLGRDPGLTVPLLPD